MSETDDDDYYDDTVYCAAFIGPCTCEHDEEQHNWGSCGVDDCPCEAGWEEEVTTNQDAEARFEADMLLTQKMSELLAVMDRGRRRRNYRIVETTEYQGWIHLHNARAYLRQESQPSQFPSVRVSYFDGERIK